LGMRRHCAIAVLLSALTLSACGAERSQPDASKTAARQPTGEKISAQDRAAVKAHFAAFQKFTRAGGPLMTAMQTQDTALYRRSEKGALGAMDRYQKEMLRTASQVTDTKLRRPLIEMRSLARRSLSTFKQLGHAVDVDGLTLTAIVRAEVALGDLAAQRQRVGTRFVALLTSKYGADSSRLGF
jgi:hypothetical protein